MRVSRDHILTQYKFIVNISSNNYLSHNVFVSSRDHLQIVGG